MGSCCIQLAVASGAEVISTASSRNFEYCKKLGAKECFDYHDEDVEDQIVEALKGKTAAGAYHAVGSDGAVQACARIMDRVKGKAIVVTVRGVPDEGIPKSVRAKSSKSHHVYQRRVHGDVLTLPPSLVEQHLPERRGPVHLEEVLAQGVGDWHHRTGPRAICGRRGAAVGTTGTRQAEEGRQCREGCRDEHLVASESSVFAFFIRTCTKISAG